MEVFVDTVFDICFRIGVDMGDTVLTMKQKIEKLQRIPVSKQTLYFDSKVLDDNLDIKQCKILNNSRIFLEISPNNNPNQNNDQLPQIEQSPTKPSDRSNEFVNPQASPVMVKDQVLPQNEPPLRTAEPNEEFLMKDWQEVMGKTHQMIIETIYSHDQLLRNISKVMMDSSSQMLHLIEKLSVASNSTADAINILGQALSNINNTQRSGLGKGKDKENIRGQYSQVMMDGRNSQVLHRNEQLSVPSDSSGEAIYRQDQALSDIFKIQRFGLEESDISKIIHDQCSSRNMTNVALPLGEAINGQDQYPTTTDPTKQSPSNKTKEIKNDHQHSTKTDQKDQSSLLNSGINIQYSPAKVTNNSKNWKPLLHICVLPFQKTEKYCVLVYPDDKVESLRKRLADKNQLGVFSLPEGEFFFINKQHVLIDDQTFEENRVAQFDTFEILGRKFSVRSSRSNYRGSKCILRSNKKNSLRSNLSQELRATQDLPPVPAGNKEIKSKQSLNPVSVKRRISITPDLPESKRMKRMEFTVTVQPFKDETRKFQVNVNSDEKVEEMRTKLAKLKEKGELHLPEEGYFFIHKQYVLSDHHTFEENNVVPGDTIEIFRGSVTY